MKITAVIVTYNRIGLLKKCLAHIQDQTKKPDEIIVINNGATDGTTDWLLHQPHLHCVTQVNGGGAGGFHTGILEAYRRGAEWIWLMDDDTMPHRDALERLLETLHLLGADSSRTGFLSSAVLWKDGRPHEMNRTYALHDRKRLEEFSFAKQHGLQPIQFGTFVSMLLSAKAVEAAGLPIREYFIWNDDVEYSKRIISKGLAGLAVPRSMITHETPANHESNVFTDPPSSLWKFRHGFRNELYTKRLHEGRRKFWMTWVHRMGIMPFRILLRRTNHRWPFIKMVWATSLSALFFRPKVKKTPARSTGRGIVTGPSFLEAMEQVRTGKG